jgi:hypothetical protein
MGSRSWRFVRYADVAIYQAPPARGPTRWKPGRLRVVGRESYARFPNGIGTSKLATVLTNARLGVTPAARDWNTVLKLLELADR